MARVFIQDKNTRMHTDPATAGTVGNSQIRSQIRWEKLYTGSKIIIPDPDPGSPGSKMKLK